MLTPDLARRFTTLRLLGQGGMGAVYLAEDAELRRQVAIKVMRADVALDAAYRARFKREMRVLARVAHPGVVKVLDVSSAGRRS